MNPANLADRAPGSQKVETILLGSNPIRRATVLSELDDRSIRKEKIIGQKFLCVILEIPSKKPVVLLFELFSYTLESLSGGPNPFHE